MSYLWLRALHVIFVMSWFAGLVYIFRLFVYHVENRDKPDATTMLITMERRLYRAICWPGFVGSALFGVWMLVLVPGHLSQGWFHVKATALIGLIGYHFYCGHIRRRMAAGEYPLTSKQCRMLNEVPTVLMMIIVIFVVVKPF
ncbi:MAG: protoporphyrinogen oxidase HemJ [Myxococcales bacterium FL481]|nr:MAG: protoporphyrinogen oxidase HemJ [Myxococcales bacterium FL481]